MAAVAIWSELLGSGTIKSPGKLGAQTEIVIPSNLTVAVFSPFWQAGSYWFCKVLAMTVSTGGVALRVGEGDASSKAVAEIWLDGAGAGVREARSCVDAGIFGNASSCVSSGVADGESAGVSENATVVPVAGGSAVAESVPVSWARAPNVGDIATKSMTSSVMAQNMHPVVFCFPKVPLV